MRQPFPGDDLPGNLRNHLCEEIKAAIIAVDSFLDYELPGGTVRNLQASRKELSRAWSSAMAAALIAEEVG